MNSLTLLTRLLQELRKEANTNQYHTPPIIVPATRSDQLREPDLDDLAPITSPVLDYRSTPSPPRPRANNHQGVTYTVIDPVTAVCRI